MSRSAPTGQPEDVADLRAEVSRRLDDGENMLNFQRRAGLIIFPCRAQESGEQTNQLKNMHRQVQMSFVAKNNKKEEEKRGNAGRVLQTHWSNRFAEINRLREELALLKNLSQATPFPPVQIRNEFDRKRILVTGGAGIHENAKKKRGLSGC